MTRVFSFALLVVVACGGGNDEVTFTAPEATSSASELPCQVQLRTTATTETNGTVTLRAFVAASEAPVTATIAAPCPGDGVRFTGLPANYDPYGVCTAGFCPDGEPRTLTFTSEWQEVGSVSITPSGDECNPPLPSGFYAIGFELASEVSACAVGAASFEAP